MTIAVFLCIIISIKETILQKEIRDERLFVVEEKNSLQEDEYEYRFMGPTVLVAIAFLMAGFMKSTQPIETLAQRMSWVKSFPAAFVRFVGIAEVLGGIGLILPALTHILSWLTPIAAIGLVIVMIGAIIYHASRREYSNIGVNMVLLLLAAFIAYGRFMIVPIA